MWKAEQAPAPVAEYGGGESYSLPVEHGRKRICVHATAGFIPNALRGFRAEVAFLGIGTRGNKDKDYREDYRREVVEAVSPRRIIPIHWDNFWRPLDRRPVPMGFPLDDFHTTMEFLQGRGNEPAWK